MAGGQSPKLAAVAQNEEKRRMSKTELLQPRIREEETEIDGMEGTVLLRSLSIGARSELRERTKWGTEEFDEDEFTMLLVVYSIKEPQLNEDDIKALMEMDQSIYEMLVLKISLLNMLGVQRDLPKVSETTGNSDSDSN